MYSGMHCNNCLLCRIAEMQRKIVEFQPMLAFLDQVKEQCQGGMSLSTYYVTGILNAYMSNVHMPAYTQDTLMRMFQFLKLSENGILL